MGNKYSKWFDGTRFNNNVRLSRRYENIDMTPVCIPSVSYEYRKISIEKPGRFKGELNEIQETILSLITAHGFLSVKQIKTLLELKGKDISMSEINQILEYLTYYNFIRRNMVTPRKTTYDLEKHQYINSSYEGIKLYSQGAFRPYDRKNFPLCPLKNIKMLMQESGNTLPTFAICMHIANQILLNNIIYNGNVQRFRLAQVKYLPGMRLAIPLEMVTENRTYFFINSVFLSSYKLQEILSNWTDYALSLQGKDNKVRDGIKKTHRKNENLPQRRYDRFTLVLITSNTIQLMQIMDIVKNADIKDFDVAFTVYDDWYQPKKGTFFQKEAIK